MSKQLRMLAGVAVFAALVLAGTVGAFAVGVAQPVQADHGSTHATRSFTPASGTVEPGGSLTVHIQRGDAFVITETLPAGFTFASTTLEASDYTVDGQNVEFTVFLGSSFDYTVTAPSTAGSHAFAGTAKFDRDRANDRPVGGMSNVTVRAGDTGGGPMPETGDVGTVEASSSTPGSGAEYVVKFTIEDGANLTAGDWIEFQFTDDLSVPDSIAANTISIKGTGDNGSIVAAPPASVAVDGGDDDPWEVRMRLGDMSDADGLQGLMVSSEVTIIIEKAAGIKNSTKGGLEPDDIGWQVLTSANDNDGENYDITGFNIYRKVSVSSEEEPRGEEILATAKGFEKNTTVTFISKPKGMTNTTNVCSGTANSDGIAECSFRLLKSLFGNGTVIVLTARDGDGNAAHYDKGTKEITLDKSMSVDPQQANVGDTINIRLVDFGVSATSASDISISFRGMMVCGGSGDDCSVQGLTDNNGEIQFDYMIPPDVRPGSQTLAVSVGNVSDDVTIAVGSGSLSVTATEVLPNQRISLSASGFTRPDRGQSCGVDANDETVYIGESYSDSSVTLGGEQIGWGRINGGDDIEVTSGGGWSASLDLPIDDITTDPGTYELKIVDCHGGQATVDLTFPAREVTMSPEMGRVGSEVVITGSNFPVANDEYNDVDVTVSYTSGEEEDSDRTETDALGNFTIIMEVPEDAGIPSNNTVRVSFNKDGNLGSVDQSFTHRVPQGSVSFSSASGAEGSLLTISATGFARYTSVSDIMFGDRDITPLPKPSTGRTGDAEFQVRIPGADPGIYIIKVVIDDVTATQIFTVESGSGVVDGSVESILANVMSEDALDRVFKFDNATKDWQWFINDPAFASTNNLAGLSSGDLVWIKVSKSVTADILGTSTTLTCINEGNENEDCWNQISIP